MAVVFETALRNHMLDRLNTFTLGGATTEFRIAGGTAQGGVGNNRGVGNTLITIGVASNAVRSSSSPVVMTIPAGNTVKSISLLRYDPTVGGGIFYEIGWKNTPKDFVFATIGTITITSLTLSIANA